GEDGVPGGDGQGAVEEEVGVHPTVERPKRLQIDERVLEDEDLIATNSLGGKGGDLAFEGAADFEEVGKRSLGAPEHGVEHANGSLGSGGFHANAAALGDLDQPFGFELLHRFTEDGAGDAEGKGEFALGGQQVVV